MATDNPPVLAQPLAALDIAARDLRFDYSSKAGKATATMIVSLTSMQFVRPATRSAGLAWEGWHRVEQVSEWPAVMRIDACQ